MSEVNLIKASTLIWLVTIGLVLGIISYWSFFPYNPLVINTYRVQQKTVKSGSHMTYEIDFCKNMALSAEVTRSFVNGIVFNTDTITINNPAGCKTNFVSIQVPQEIPSGVYRLRSTWVYKVNPIRDIVITMDTNTFEIEGSDITRQDNQN